MSDAASPRRAWLPARAAFAAAAAVAAAFAPGAGNASDVLDFSDLKGWEADDHAAALRVFVASCDAARVSESVPGLTESDWREVCREARTAADPRAFFESAFAPVAIGDDAPGLITGYYEPELTGARRRHGAFRHPLHRAPEDAALRGLTRAEIRAGALDGAGLEIAWLDDPVAAFFLHVQGSGRIRLDDGTVLRLGYGGRNGHPYRSIGRALIDSGEMSGEDMTAQGIRAWLRDGGEARLSWLDLNPSYIFFREIDDLDPQDGPIGALGVPLAAMRSVAVDPARIPLGAPVWLETRTPDGPFAALTVAQDVGAAINGAQRADLFFGSGDAAGVAAGAMRAPGRLTALLPRAAALRLAGE